MAKKYVVTRKQLIKAAEDMNKVMGLEPQIDSSLPTEELLEMMKEAFEFVEPDDEFTKETWDIVNARANLEIVGDIEEKEEVTRERAQNKRDRQNGAKQDMQIGKTKDRTRAQIMADILKSTKDIPLSRKEIINRMHEFYGGSVKSARFQVDFFFGLLKALNLVEEKEGKWSYKGDIQ